MRFSAAITTLLLGLEAAALRAVPRTGPEIERAVCTFHNFAVQMMVIATSMRRCLGASMTFALQDRENQGPPNCGHKTKS
jgi:hypothetical protein